MGDDEIKAGGNPAATDKHLINGEVDILPSQLLHAKETRISSGLMGHLARMQTFYL